MSGIKLNKEEIRKIAIQEFHHRHFDSIYDCWTHALEVWLTQKGLKISPVQAEGEATADPDEAGPEEP